jgi:hypothetical protein
MGKSQGILGALGRRPGCAPQLQCACLMSIGRLPAQLSGCISVPSAWLQGNAPPFCFSRASPSVALLGRFQGDSWQWQLACAGSVKPPRALPLPVKSAAFISVPSLGECPSFVSIASPPNPVRDRQCAEVWCPARRRSSLVGFLSFPPA